MEEYMSNTKMLLSCVLNNHLTAQRNEELALKFGRHTRSTSSLFPVQDCFGLEKNTLIWNKELCIQEVLFNLNLTNELEWETKHLDLN